MADQLVNLKDPDTGEIGSLPASQVPQALQQGFTQATPDEVGQFFNEKEYGTPGQQAATALEGAGSALTFGASTGVERALGVSGEGIRARRETNPIAHGAGELLGLGAGMLTGTGEAAALEGAGSAVSRVSGAALPEAYALNKIGSSAARMAAENVLFQGGDEVSKMFAGDPHQSVGTAMADIGLAGLIGAGAGTAFGAVSPLWKATAGKQVESFLNAIKSKAGGVEGLTSQPIKEALDQAGVDVSPATKALLSDDKSLQGTARLLEAGDRSASNIEVKNMIEQDQQSLSNVVAASLGKTPEEIQSLAGEPISKAEAGRLVGEAIAKDLSAKIDPLAKEFEELKGKVGNVELPGDTILETPRTVTNPQDLVGTPQTVIDKTKVPGVLSQAGEKIAELAAKEGWLAAEDTPIGNLVQFTQKNLGKQKTLKDLGNFISRLGEKAESLSSLTDRSASRAGSMIKSILKDVESSVIESKLGEAGPELVERFKNVRNAWKEASGLADQVQEQIGVRASTSGFAKAVKQMAAQDGEALLRRIGGSGNAAGLRLLQEQFPEAAKIFKEYHLDSVIRPSAMKAKSGNILNVSDLSRRVNNLSPEMKQFILSPEAQEKIRAVEALQKKMADVPKNYSNTASFLDRMNEHVLGGGAAIAGALSGHAILGALLGGAAKYLTKDVPDAVRLAMLKFMTSPEAVDAAGFKAMTEFAASIAKGEAAVTKGARAVLKSGAKVGSHDQVSDRGREKLDKQLEAYRENPEKLMNLAGDIGHYMPDHATAVAATAAQAVQYLNSLRPDTQPKMPLDRKLPPDPVKQAQFDRALDIAQNPLIVFEDVKNGTVTMHDLTTLQNVAPGLYSRMRDKLGQELIGFKSEKNEIPYKTRLGLALFMGQPLDSTMTPSAIQAAQPQPPMQAPQMAQAKPSKQGMQKLGKLPGMSADAGQSREMERAKHIS